MWDITAQKDSVFLWGDVCFSSSAAQMLCLLWALVFQESQMIMFPLTLMLSWWHGSTMLLYRGGRCQHVSKGACSSLWPFEARVHKTSAHGLPGIVYFLGRHVNDPCGKSSQLCFSGSCKRWKLWRYWCKSVRGNEMINNPFNEIVSLNSFLCCFLRQFSQHCGLCGAKY